MSKLDSFLASIPKTNATKIAKPVLSTTKVKVSTPHSDGYLKSMPSESKSVAAGITLYTTKMEDPGTGQVIGIRYEGGSTSSDPVTLTVNIEGSRNIAYIGSGSRMSRSAEISPGGREQIGEERLTDASVALVPNGAREVRGGPGVVPGVVPGVRAPGA